MIYPILISLAGIFNPTMPEKAVIPFTPETVTVINFQDPPSAARLRVVEFKAQDYCRAELKDFNFDARFVIVSADVYFSGANFSNVLLGHITSSSLAPIKPFMARCTVGSAVTFDNIKVKGPDNEIRSIDGVTYVLY